MRKTIVISAMVVVVLMISTAIAVPIKNAESVCKLDDQDYECLVEKIDLMNDSDSMGEDTFDKQISMYMKLAHMPSLSVCIIKNDSLVWYQGYGECSQKEEKIPTRNTIYMVASISKTVTATAILQLNESGYFGLDDDVSPYLPFDLKNPNFPDINITFRMLLAHQSSIQELNKLILPFYFTFLGNSFDWFDEFLIPGGGLYNSNIWSDEAPGENDSYSSINFVILGHIVKTISNQSFNSYCKEHIFSPLDMSDTSFYLGDFEYDEIATPYL